MNKDEGLLTNIQMSSTLYLEPSARVRRCHMSFATRLRMPSRYDGILGVLGLPNDLALARSLQFNHETTEPNLKGFLDEEEELSNTLAKLQRNLADHMKLMEDAWEQRYISVAL